MKKHSSRDTLNNSIVLLEIKQKKELEDLKEEFQKSCDLLSPLNILKSGFKNVLSPANLNRGLGSTAIGMASGYIVKSILFRSSLNPIKIIARIVLEAIAIKFAAKNSEQIKSAGQKFIKSVTSRFTSITNREHN